MTQTRRSERFMTAELEIIEGRFPANAAWLALAAIVHNLTRAAGALASAAHAWARGATIRRDLIDVAARTARHGRSHLTLHLPEAWHRQAEWMSLFHAELPPVSRTPAIGTVPPPTKQPPPRPPGTRIGIPNAAEVTPHRNPECRSTP